jgi:hypothetical protein
MTEINIAGEHKLEFLHANTGVILKNMVNFVDENCCYFVLFNNIYIQTKCHLTEGKVGMASPGTLKCV